jgi:Bacteriophage Lambda NinG protein
VITKHSQINKGQAVKQLKKQYLRSAIKAKLWDAFSLFIRKRDNFTCFTCGKSKESHPDTVFQAGHLFSQIKTAIQYDERNVHCQCYSCNTKHNTDPDIYREKFIEKYGRELFDRLYEMKNQPCKRSKSDLLILLDYYKQKLTQLP